MQKEFYTEYYQVDDKHWWFVGRRQIILKLLDQRFRRNSQDRDILDVGCGTGAMLTYLARYGKVVGIDADAAAISFCRQRGLQNVQQYDGMRFPFEDGRFDLVTMFDVLEHIEDDNLALREILRVLKPTGTLMLTVPAYPILWGAQDEISHHKRRYVAAQLRAKLKNSRFSIDKISYFNSFLFPGIAAVRLLRHVLKTRRASVGDLKSDFTLTKGRGVLNSLLSSLFGLERYVVAGPGFPFGVSVIAIANRPQ